MSSTRSVGVDFGTTTSLVSEGVAGRQPVVFPLGRTTTWLPSLVGLDVDDAVSMRRRRGRPTAQPRQDVR